MSNRPPHPPTGDFYGLGHPIGPMKGSGLESGPPGSRNMMTTADSPLAPRPGHLGHRFPGITDLPARLPTSSAGPPISLPGLLPGPSKVVVQKYANLIVNVQHGITTDQTVS